MSASAPKSETKNTNLIHVHNIPPDASLLHLLAPTDAKL